jgi:hypothetical protein
LHGLVVFLAAYRVHLTAKRFNYQTYRATTQGFKVVTKKTAELPTAEGSVLGGIQSCLCSGEVVLDETGVAALYLDKKLLQEGVPWVL